MRNNNELNSFRGYWINVGTKSVFWLDVIDFGESWTTDGLAGHDWHEWEEIRPESIRLEGRWPVAFTTTSGARIEQIKPLASATLATGCLNDDVADVLPDGSIAVHTFEYVNEWSDCREVRFFASVSDALAWYESTHGQRVADEIADNSDWVGMSPADYLDAAAGYLGEYVVA